MVSLTVDDFDVIIIGAGAAGLMTGIEASKRKNKVLILDHSKKIGEKIRISGGGRCNFTNIGASAENYLSNNPHFCKSALAQYRPQDFIKLIEKYKIPYHEKKLGQLFCDHSSKAIIDMLLNELRVSSASILADTKIEKIIYQPESKQRFILKTRTKDFFSKSLVIATGGLSIPQIGASDFGYKVAKQFNLKIIQLQPALVPFTFKDNHFYKNLAGISFDSQVSLEKKISFRENLLFTHKGLSGPAILQISLYWQPGEKVIIDLSPNLDIKNFLLENKKNNSGKKKIKNLLPFNEKFLEELENNYPLEKKLAECSNTDLEMICQGIHQWKISPDGTEGFNKAEVTKGGIDTTELNSKTMEAKKAPGLYFVGEVVDVTGWLGGYNFQWAWASGYACGQQV